MTRKLKRSEYVSGSRDPDKVAKAARIVGSKGGRAKRKKVSKKKR